MISKARIFIGVGLCLIIFAVAMLGAKYKDEWFKSEITVQYPDRCIEKYVNQKLVTDECTKGRILMNQKQKKPEVEASQIIMPNLTLVNLT
jgi:hypothetical protein